MNTEHPMPCLASEAWQHDPDQRRQFEIAETREGFNLALNIKIIQKSIDFLSVCDPPDLTSRPRSHTT
jgi:hypothetical protein